MAPPGHADKVMHMSFQVGETTIFASDGRAENKPEFKGFALSVMADDVAQAEKKFNALAVGGQVQMPLTKTFFSPLFGMLTDKFGLMWMVLVKQ
jgi:PhnB protein